VIISFGWTSQYLPPHGNKTVTRRLWSPRTLKTWQKAWDEGQLEHQAWNQAPFVKNARQIGTVRLTARPYLERLGDMSESDIAAEGGMASTVLEFANKYFDGNLDLELTVIRFTFVPSPEFCKSKASW